MIDFAAVQGWHGLTPTVQPNQMLGLEINHYAAELARTALWIGYIQWHQANGFGYTQRPILTPLGSLKDHPRTCGAICSSLSVSPDFLALVDAPTSALLIILPDCRPQRLS